MNIRIELVLSAAAIVTVLVIILKNRPSKCSDICKEGNLSCISTKCAAFCTKKCTNHKNNVLDYICQDKCYNN